MILTLEEAKRHLRVDLDYTDDDMYIEELIDMSEIDIANRLKFDSLTDVFPDGIIPLPVKHAAKLVVAHYYENREPIAFVSSSKVPMMVDSLLFPYVRYYNPKDHESALHNVTSPRLHLMPVELLCFITSDLGIVQRCDRCSRKPL